MFKFICSECGTHYSSSQSTPPPGIKWSDGHICSPILVKDHQKLIIDNLKYKLQILEESSNTPFKRINH